MGGPEGASRCLPCTSVRKGQEFRTTPAPPALTCGVARAPHCSHLSRRGLLPDHSTQAVLSTDLMGLCQGARNVSGGGVRGVGRDLAAGSGRPRPLQDIYPHEGESFPSRTKLQAPSPTTQEAPPQSPAVGWECETLTGTPLGTALPVFILWAPAGCSPEEGPQAGALPPLCATSTCDAAAAPRRPGLPLPIHCGTRPCTEPRGWG